MHNKYPNLFSPLYLPGLTLKNRVFSAPTSLADINPDETYNEKNYEYYKVRALSGVAMVCVGDVIVDLPAGRSHPLQVGINEPAARTSFVRMAQAIHAGGAAASVEIDHGGALALGDPEMDGKVYGPSEYIDPWGELVLEMSEEQIIAAAEKYGEAAARAKEYGFDLVMIHGGHGWLVHQFLSPITNHRTDKWGGSLENRMRFMLLVVEKVRAAVGKNFPIEIRISGSERTEGGYDIETGIEIAKALDGKVDLIHVSAGTQQVPYSCVLMHPGTFEKDMENRNLAEEIKKHVKTPVVSVGAYNFGWQMEETIASGKADAVAIGRAILADNMLIKKIRDGHEEDITPCLRCSECLGGMMKNGCISCSVNPIIGREQEFTHPIPTFKRKKVLIAGGGPAGMMAAFLAHRYGHLVTLCEADDHLGGALKFAESGEPFKQTIKRYKDSMIDKIQRLPIKVMLGTRVDEKLVEEIRPDVIIAAVGADPVVLPIPGADGDNVVIGADLTPDTPLGDRVVIIGGGFIGCEEAITISGKGKQVTIVEMTNELAVESNPMYRMSLLHQVEKSGAQLAMGQRCSAISAEGVSTVDRDGQEHFYPADSVVFAAGMRPRRDEVERLRPLCNEFYNIGSSHRAGTIGNAVRMAYDAVINMGF